MLFCFSLEQVTYVSFPARQICAFTLVLGIRICLMQHEVWCDHVP